MCQKPLRSYLNSTGPPLGFFQDGWQTLVMGRNEKKLQDFTYVNTLLDGKCQDFGQGTGFQDGWRHPLPKIDGWPATRATRSNGGPALCTRNMYVVH